MLKKFLTTIYLLALTTTPVQALPIWAELIARSQCEYMAMGVDWETAIAQALRDNFYWFDEVRASPIAATTLVYAAREACPAVYQKSFDEHQRQQETQPVSRDGMSNL